MSLHLDDLQELVELFRDADLRAELDPAKVQTPGVWIRQNTITWDRLNDGATMGLTVYLVTGTTDPERVARQLQELADKALPVIKSLWGPSGPARYVALTLPRGTYPAIEIPLDLLID